MRTLGFDKPLYILPFDHRGSFVTKMFGWHGALTPEQAAEIAGAKQVIYDGFRSAVTAGVPKEKAGILVDEQFGAAILRDAAANGFVTACPNTLSFFIRLSAKCSFVTTRRAMRR